MKKMNEIIQIAGIIDKAEAEMLMCTGADFLGFPLRLPVNKEDLTEEEAAEVIGIIHQPHRAVLITYLNKADEIIELCVKLNVGIVQLHGKIAKEELKRIRILRPDLTIIKSLVVAQDNYTELEKLVDNLSEWTDVFITDTFDPSTGAEGATGKTHDWNISRKLVSVSPKPVIIAGGLNPANVKDAVLQIRPAGVDVHTGVEDKSGRKNLAMVTEFIKKAREGFEIIRSQNK